MNQTIWTILKGSLLEGEKGSGKAMCAFASMLIILFMCIYSTIKNTPIDLAVILELIGFILTLYGIKGWTAVKLSKNGSSSVSSNPDDK